MEGLQHSTHNSRAAMRVQLRHILACLHNTMLLTVQNVTHTALHFLVLQIWRLAHGMTSAVVAY